MLTFDEALWALLLARPVVRQLLKRLHEVVGEVLPQAEGERRARLEALAALLNGAAGARLRKSPVHANTWLRDNGLRFSQCCGDFQSLIALRNKGYYE